MRILIEFTNDIVYYLLVTIIQTPTTNFQRSPAESSLQTHEPSKAARTKLRHAPTRNIHTYTCMNVEPNQPFGSDHGHMRNRILRCSRGTADYTVNRFGSHR